MLKLYQTGGLFLVLSLLILAAALAPASALAENPLLKQAEKQIIAQKFKGAIRTLTRAMNSGDLSDDEMARVLYKRGVAQNGAKKYGSAIADLTGGLSLNKLGALEKKDALIQRAVAWKAMGYSKQASSDMSLAGGVAQGAAMMKAPSMAAIGAFSTVVKPRKSNAKSAIRRAGKAVRKRKKAAKIPAFRTSVSNN